MDIATLVGLVMGVALLIYAVLQTKTTQLVDSLEMASVKFLNMLTEKPAGEVNAG